MTFSEEFQSLLTWLKTRWGISVRETQWAALSHFWEERRDGRSLAEYQIVVEARREEKAALIDAATIGETYFFRDEAQFRVLQKNILPLFRALNFRMPSLWSAACSTGEEALSLLVLLADTWGVPVEACRNKVWASDLNPRALKKFAAAVFGEGSLRQDGQSFHRLLAPYMEKKEKELHFQRRVVDLVSLRELNLITDRLDSLPEKMDIILLRNMMIYVSVDERPVIYRKITEKLSPEGVLVLGKAELPFFQEPSMGLVEIDGTFVLIKKTSRLWSSEKVGKVWYAAN